MAPTDPTKAHFGKARRAATDPEPHDQTFGDDARRPNAEQAPSTADGSASVVDQGSFDVVDPDRGTTVPADQVTPAPGQIRQAEPARRGKLVMAAKVVEKVAAQAASEAAAGGRSGGLLGIGAKTDLSARPKVDVDLSGTTATIDVEVAVAYPTPIRQATEQVRTHVIDRVHQLTGVTVTRIDIDVTGFHPVADHRQEKLR